MTAAALEVADLTAGYGQTRIVEGMTFSVAAGSCLAILGRNGMGKTTLLASLVGLAKMHGGSIRLGGGEIGALPTAARAHRGLGYVPQTREVFRSLTVEENLRTGLKGRPVESLDEAYVMFPRLAERRRNMAGHLSGGEQQMLSTARAVLGRPSVLLLDEPLEGLAPVVCDELMRTFADLARTRQTTVVIVEQQIQRALDIAVDVMVMERGRAAWAGRSVDLQARPDLIERHLGVGLH